MTALRHRHWFSAMWWHFGPYGRQDVHVHSCIKETHDERCDRVVIGEGRECKSNQHHWRETLTDRAPH